MAAKTRFYVDRQNAKVAGVCAGIADYTGWNVRAVRLGVVVIAVLTHLVALIAYSLTAWLAPDKPAGLYDTPDDARFWQGVRANPGRSTAEVRSSFRDLDRRLADLETLYTSRNTALATEIDRLR